MVRLHPPLPTASDDMGKYYDIVPKGFRDNLEFRREVLVQCARNKKRAAEVRAMCAEDILFYVNTFVWTDDPRVKPKPNIPFITYPFQDEAMLTIVDCIEKGQDCAIEKSRDMGASWMNLTCFEWLWHFRELQSFLMISRNEDYVDKKGNPKSLFWKIDFIHKNEPSWLLPTGRWLRWDDPGRKLLHLENADNGSVIDGEGTTGDAGRGDRRTAALIDEFAAFELNDGFSVLASTRDMTKCRIFNSTPKGSGNAFYNVTHKTAAVRISLHWSRHPEKNRGLYRAKANGVERLDKWSGAVDVVTSGKSQRIAYPAGYPFVRDGKVRSPWYDEECKRCVSQVEISQELDIDYLGSSYQFFDPAFIEGVKKIYGSEPTSVGDIDRDSEGVTPKRFTASRKGHLSLWIPAPSGACVGDAREFIVGADVSAGTGASNSTAAVYERLTREKVAEYACPNILPADFGRYIVALAKYFNGAKVVPDRSGPTGEVMVKTMIEEGYTNIYYSRNEKKMGRDITDKPGVYLNPQMRASCLESYRDALGKYRIVNHSVRALDECLKFIRNMDGSVEHSGAANSIDPSGARAAHGDIVIADALACLELDDSGVSEKTNEPEMPLNCIGRRLKEKKQNEEIAKSDYLPAGW